MVSCLDVVIFGATGFTGKYAVEEMVRLANKHAITWGVAGRSHNKLKELMTNTSRKTGENLSHIKVIVADVDNEESILEMCRQAKVLVNCCGPYIMYGEVVVRSAIRAGTHYVDVSGEPQFMERMQVQYSSAAREAAVYVVSACAYDSIPNDMGLVYLQQNFEGTLNSVESYVTTTVPDALRRDVRRQGSVHYGTWASLVYSLANYGELKPLRKKLFPESLPTLKPKLKRRCALHKRVGRWCTLFPGVDDSVVYRTQRHQYETQGQRPVQFRTYQTYRSLLHALGLALRFGLLFMMSKLACTRRLLLNHPRLFSFGKISHEGPTEAVMRAQTFQMELFGEGWPPGADVNASPPSKKVAVKVSGVNPAYGATVVALVLSAVTILREHHNMPGTGGVLTTGAAFRNTNLIKSLHEENIKFEIVNLK